MIIVPTFTQCEERHGRVLRRFHPPEEAVGGGNGVKSRLKNSPRSFEVLINSQEERRWDLPVVRSISPHMGETVHDKSRVQRPHVANEARVKAYEPRLVPCEDRHQYRHREAQREHNDLVIPGTIRANVKEKSCSLKGEDFSSNWLCFLFVKDQNSRRNLWKSVWMVKVAIFVFWDDLLVEEFYHGIGRDVAHVDFTTVLLHCRVPFNHQPADVGEEESTSRVVWISARFRVSVVRPVVPYPFVKVRLIEKNIRGVIRDIYLRDKTIARMLLPDQCFVRNNIWNLIWNLSYCSYVWRKKY